MRWRRHLTISSAIALAVAACGSDASASCVSGGVGEVCADNSGGGITFSGSGLAPGSSVEMRGPEGEPLVLQVGDDGSFDSGSGAVGFLYAFPDVELTFIVSAIESTGDRIDGDIVISS